MSKAVLDVAQAVMDSFYQSFRPAESFYELTDFAIRVVNERDEVLDQEFKLLWQAQRDRNSYAFIRVNPMWLARTTAEIKKDEERNEWYADICEPIYEFPLDDIGFGIQNVEPFGSKCADFIRIENSQDWMTCMTASANVVMYSVIKCRIILYGFDGFCTEKLDVRIVPSQSSLPYDQQTLPDGIAGEVSERVISKLWRDYSARLGKIPMEIDGNMNPVPNDAAPVYDNLKTK